MLREKVQRDEHGPVCADCGARMESPVYGGRKRRTSLRCWTCNRTHYMFKTILTGKGLAGAAVTKAKNAGLLKPASSLACTDCGEQAHDYDHRDYNRPLDVVPVCRSCNIKRGAAIPFNPLLVGLLLLAATRTPSPTEPTTI